MIKIKREYDVAHEPLAEVPIIIYTNFKYEGFYRIYPDGLSYFRVWDSETTHGGISERFIKYWKYDFRE